MQRKIDLKQCRVCLKPSPYFLLKSLFDGAGEQAKMLQAVSGINVKENFTNFLDIQNV